VANQVKKTLLVDAEELNKFHLRNPSHGAFTWFVNAALRRYNEINETSAEELIALSVDELSLHDDH
jgi:hypothetical protein